MRILQLRFKNLNSLAGEWLIDFTHPAFTADGLFAITGPTGAGKTTILDAICLALYGRTPRLSRISKGMNETMSRQSGECFAEVCFETQSGRFRCHWSQHRARKKPDGDLQPPKHEIADADSGQLLESKIKGVAEQIEKVTGMDFDRFTRSMLLAQGGFAAFLQAAPDERAPILEQITGTEIYSRISVRVHESRSEQRKKLDQLQAELAGVQILTPEAEEKLADELSEKSGQDVLLQQQRKQKQQAIQWLERIEHLGQTQKQLETEQEGLQLELEAFAPEQAQLDSALRAVELSAPYAGLKSLRQSQEQETRQLEAHQSDLPAFVTKAQQAQAESSAASEAYTTARAAFQAQQPLIRAVRELDTKITAQTRPVEELRHTVQSRQEAINTLQLRQRQETDALNQQQAQANEIEKLLAASHVDEALTTELTGLQSRFRQLQTQAEQLHLRQQEDSSQAAQLSLLEQQWQQACEQQETAAKQRQLDEQAYTAQQKLLNDCLGDKTLTQWRHEHTALIQRQNQLEITLKTVESICQTELESSELRKRDEALVQEIQTVEPALERTKTGQQQLNKELEYLETQLLLLNRIDDLSQARQHLRDGEPCPLCGSPEHPYAQGNIPEAGKTQQQLEQIKQQLKESTEIISGLQVQQAKIRQEREQITVRLQAFNASADAFWQQIKQDCQQLNIREVQDTTRLGEILREQLQQHQQQLNHFGETLAQAEQIEQTLADLRQALESSKNAELAQSQRVHSLMSQKTASAQTSERLKREVQNLTEQQHQSLEIIRHDLKIYHIDNVALARLNQIEAELTSRLSQWRDRHQQYSGLTEKISARQIQIQHNTEQLHRMTAELTGQQEKLAGLEQELLGLKQQRFELSGDRNIDAEEMRLIQSVENAEKVQEEKRQQLLIAQQVQQQLQQKINDLANSLAGRKKQLETTRKEFTRLLQRFQFADEAQYLSACLSADERQKLTEKSQQLAEKQTRLQTLLQETTVQLTLEQEKKLTDELPETLREADATMSEQQKQLQQMIGGIRQQLQENDRLRQKQQSRLTLIEAQQRECARWDTLHELIGSADGKKFRNFAQGLTFEMMIGHANQQLQKMTDRYLLVHDPLSPLELSVIDNYQAGEVRSAKNLSGGESFIVSLALALGLSGMASQNIRVDSLFLDEGFGTLDEEALDTALETLAGLQQEGKLIGVISHVAALKERISTQISVIPGNGGQSSIEGAGVCRTFF